MQLSMAAHATGGVLRGHDVTFTGVAIDSRQVEQGDLFVALSGENHDGHRFAHDAAGAGAIGLMTSHDVGSAVPEVRVEDTQAALAALAASWRARFSLPVVGITGSNGKTTVKNMLSSILVEVGNVMATRGNLNNHIGLPLTLLRLRSSHRFAVVEMGMNHIGEIASLASIARPSVAVITNAAAAHLEGLGSVAAVASAKGELIESLGEKGIAVINHDDPHHGQWRSLAGSRQVVTFGFSDGKQDVDVAGYHDNGETFLDVSGKEIQLHLAFPGRHNVANAMAAAAAALALGVDATDIRTGLESARPAPGRLSIHRAANGARVIDDSYNANPASLAAAVQVLCEYSSPTILVLGDMAELGDDGPKLHKRCGTDARKAGVDYLLTLGPLSADAAKGFGKNAIAHDDLDSLMDDLVGYTGPDATILVKGSRSSAMERVIARLMPEAGEK